jgi:polyisoprenoid-binding protein YceI
MLRSRFFFFHTLLIGALILTGAPCSLFAATGDAPLSLLPASGTYGVGKTFTVSVSVDSSQPFNSASGKLNFDKEFLSVQSVSKSSSALSLWAVEPSFSNTDGTVEFEGGNTTALSGKKVLLAVTFKALKEGSAKVGFTSAAVLAADGKGTDITGVKTDAVFVLAASAPEQTPATPPAPDVSVLGPVPEAPDVSATTYPDENLYYNAPKARFTWELPPDVTVVRMALDTKSKTTPTTSYDPAINEKEFDQLVDGVMYFHLRYRNEGGWGPTTHKKIMVDRTPPAPFSMTAIPVASSTDVAMQFSATDTPSGLDHYEIIVDAGTAIKVPLAEVKNGAYTLSGQSPGEHTLTLKAYDKAGNFTAVDGKFTIEGAVPGAAKAVVDEEPKPTNWGLILNVALVALIAFLIGYLWYEQKTFRREKYVAKRESDELRESLGNIFAALREEIDEQTSALFQKPNPSAQDREVLGHINEAIDLSEELISKEAEDVRKLLM